MPLVPFSRLARVGLAALALSAAGAADGAPDPLRWRRAPDRSAGEGVTAVAADPLRGAVAFGNAQGVWLRDGSRDQTAIFRRAARTARVNDLAFDAGGDLWVAADDGLWRIEAGGRTARPQTTAPGERARRARRVAAAAGVVAVGTDLGAYVSRDGGPFRAVDAEVSPGAASALALSADGRSLVLAVDRHVWEVRLAEEGGALALVGARRVPVAAPRAGETPVDLALDVPGAALVVLYEQAIAVRAAGSPHFALHRPTLPPGARARRLAVARGRLWLATDRGLLVARSLEGPWRRAGLPAGTADVYDLAAAADGFVAGAASGLLVAEEERARVANAGPMERAPRRRALPGDPPIRAVQRAALAYLELGPARIRRLRRGLAVRGLLPEVDVRVASDHRRVRGERHDQTFTSGATRDLYDSDEDRQRDFGYFVGLTWDLPRLAYDPEAIDVSREAREVIELRDEILDEVNQLYYERRRVLGELAALSDPDASEARSLRLRAAELAAGLDAWTGGWFLGQGASGPPGLAP